MRRLLLYDNKSRFYLRDNQSIVNLKYELFGRNFNAHFIFLMEMELLNLRTFSYLIQLFPILIVQCGISCISLNASSGTDRLLFTFIERIKGGVEIDRRCHNIIQR